METLYCPLRKKWVAALPEERVRQSLIATLTQQLDYPMGSLALEKSLDQLPHLQAQAFLPKRRADLIVFGKDLHPKYAFYPLLLVECKAVPLTPATMRQLVGYNHFVQAAFIAAVNQTTSYTGYYQPQARDFCFQEGLLSYSRLLQACRARLSE